MPAFSQSDFATAKNPTFAIVKTSPVSLSLLREGAEISGNFIQSEIEEILPSVPILALRRYSAAVVSGSSILKRFRSTALPDTMSA